jgi:hypothetical protein
MEGHDLGVDIGLAHAPRDELCELAAEIGNEYNIGRRKIGQGALLSFTPERRGPANADPPLT